MAHRVNVMIDDEVWEKLKTVAAGERSRLINEALTNELLARRRAHAAAQMDRLRKRGRRAGKPAEQLLRDDRRRRK